MAVIKSQMHSFSVSGNLSTITANRKLVDLSVSPFIRNIKKNRYLDQLGLASVHETKTYCRQSLIGGNYGLLDSRTFVPNPDFYRLGENSSIAIY